jgi:TPR repeat protein
VAATGPPWSSHYKHRERLAPIAGEIMRAQHGSPESQAIFGTFLLDSPETQEEGLRWLEKAAETNLPSAFNNLAWHYATAPKASDRNGFEALRLAQKANELTAHGSAIFLDTLAAAHAELGQWDKALEAQKQALTKLKPEQTKERAMLEGHLKSYDEHQRVYENNS